MSTLWTSVSGARSKGSRVCWGRQEDYHIGVSVVAPRVGKALLGIWTAPRLESVCVEQIFCLQLRILRRRFSRVHRMINNDSMVRLICLGICLIQIGASSIHVRRGYMRQQDIATHDCGGGVARQWSEERGRSSTHSNQHHSTRTISAAIGHMASLGRAPEGRGTKGLLGQCSILVLAQQGLRFVLS
jgi:hypothetical protein